MSLLPATSYISCPLCSQNFMNCWSAHHNVLSIIIITYSSCLYPICYLTLTLSEMPQLWNCLNHCVNNKVFYLNSKLCVYFVMLLSCQWICMSGVIMFPEPKGRYPCIWVHLQEWQHNDDGSQIRWIATWNDWELLHVLHQMSYIMHQIHGITGTTTDILSLSTVQKSQ